MTSAKDTGSGNPLTDPRRERSEGITVEAEAAWRDGQHAQARKLFAGAAAIEEDVAREAAVSFPRARSAVAVAAVALWHRAGDFARAKRTAYAFLGQAEGLTEQGREDLERLVDRCSREAEVSRLTSDPGMVPVELKLDGGRVHVGVAPEVAVRRRREMFASLLRRTAEMEAHVEYRERGESELERNDQIQLLEVPAVAASYGVRFYVATGRQQRIRTEQQVTPERVVARFLALAAAAAKGAEALSDEIKDAQYRHAFLDGFAEIAPDGDDVATVACSAPAWSHRGLPLVFKPEHRRDLRAAAAAPVLRDARPGEKTLQGKLVAVHLTRSSSWIEMELEGKKKTEVVMVNEKHLRAKVATMRSGDADPSILVYAKYSGRQQRMAMTDVVSLARGRSLPAI